MKVENLAANYALIRLGIDELIILHNALNETCHALDPREFSTRLGAQLEEAKSLLDQVGDTIDTMDKIE